MVRIGFTVDMPDTSKPRFSMMLAILSLASACPLALTSSVAKRTGAVEVDVFVPGLGAAGLAGDVGAGLVGVGAPGLAGDVVPGLTGVTAPGLAKVVAGAFSPGFNGFALSLSLSMPG